MTHVCTGVCCYVQKCWTILIAVRTPRIATRWIGCKVRNTWSFWSPMTCIFRVASSLYYSVTYLQYILRQFSSFKHSLTQHFPLTPVMFLSCQTQSFGNFNNNVKRECTENENTGYCIITVTGFSFTTIFDVICNIAFREFYSPAWHSCLAPIE